MRSAISNIEARTRRALPVDIESILADPSAYSEQELCRLRDQIVSNLERAWEITGRSEDQLLSTMMQISQVVARQFNKQG